MRAFLKRRSFRPEVDDPIGYVRNQIRSFRLPGRDAVEEVLLAAPTQPPVWDAGIFVSTAQSERFYADIFEFWVRAMNCFVEDLWVGKLFHDVMPDLIVHEMPNSEFRDEFRSLLSGRIRDPAFEERQAYASTRIELERRSFGKAWLMVNRPDIRSAVAESDGEFVAYFVTTQKPGFQ